MGGKCGGCRHWHNLTGAYGTCLVVPTLTSLRPGLDGAEDPKAFVEGDDSALYTSPDFGCAQFEAKE